MKHPVKRSILCLVVAFSFLVFTAISWFSGAAPVAQAENNGLALKPIMGWSSWSFIRKSPTEAKIKAQADAMAAKLKSHGYEYINLDDFYTLDYNTQVDKYGRWAVDPAKFPSGMKALGDYIHSKGLKFGIYVTPGIPKGAVDQNTPIEGTAYHAKDIADTTKQENNYNFKGMYYIDYSKPGAQEYINSWAKLFASYGADFLKLDGVGEWDIPDVQAWSKALNNSGRSIVFALSNSLKIAYADTWKQYANSWRTQGDVECYCTTLTNWSKVSGRFGSAASWAQYAGPGGWNDLDSLDVAGGANDGLTNDEKVTTMSLWAMASAPLYSGDDLTNMDSFGLGLLTNDEVIAVDQAAVAGTQVSNTNNTQVWKKKLPDGSYDVGLFNLGAASASVTADFAALGFSGSAAVRDLYAHQNKGSFTGSYSATIPSHGATIIKLTPSSSSGGGIVSGKTYIITAKNSGKVLAVQSASLTNGANVIQWSYGTSHNDEWVLTDVGGGNYKVANVKSGKSLNVSGNSTANGAQIVQFTYSAADNMSFQLTPLN